MLFEHGLSPGQTISDEEFRKDIQVLHARWDETIP